MRIELHEIKLGEIAKGYIDNAEAGVKGYDGKLNIRPPYQREFVYDEKDRNAVVKTIINGFPLNVMYWVKNADDDFEILDGQQRTISFCQYINNEFSYEGRVFDNLTNTEKQQILEYSVMVYFCEGNDREKLDWFQIINIAGKPLTHQELLNAIYPGTWVTHAKSIFSKKECAAYNLASKYTSKSPIRQELLEQALKWINNGDVRGYMSKHQHDPNANELWTYFKNVINWITLTFPKYRKEMKGLEWGPLYDRYKDNLYDTNILEQRISELMIDDDVTNKKGIYDYVLSGNERLLNIRAFTDNQKREAYENQNGICPVCGKHFEIEEMHADHITPWSLGGKTVSDNCQMLCADCNRRKSNI